MVTKIGEIIRHSLKHGVTPASNTQGISDRSITVAQFDSRRRTRHAPLATEMYEILVLPVTDKGTLQYYRLASAEEIQATVIKRNNERRARGLETFDVEVMTVAGEALAIANDEALKKASLTRKRKDKPIQENEFRVNPEEALWIISKLVSGIETAESRATAEVRKLEAREVYERRKNPDLKRVIEAEDALAREKMDYIGSFVRAINDKQRAGGTELTVEDAFNALIAGANEEIEASNRTIKDENGIRLREGRLETLISFQEARRRAEEKDMGARSPLHGSLGVIQETLRAWNEKSSVSKVAAQRAAEVEKQPEAGGQKR